MKDGGNMTSLDTCQDLNRLISRITNSSQSGLFLEVCIIITAVQASLLIFLMSQLCAFSVPLFQFWPVKKVLQRSPNSPDGLNDYSWIHCIYALGRVHDLVFMFNAFWHARPIYAVHSLHIPHPLFQGNSSISCAIHRGR